MSYGNVSNEPGVRHLNNPNPGKRKGEVVHDLDQGDNQVTTHYDHRESVNPGGSGGSAVEEQSRLGYQHGVKGYSPPVSNRLKKSRTIPAPDAPQGPPLPGSPSGGRTD